MERGRGMTKCAMRGPGKQHGKRRKYDQGVPREILVSSMERGAGVTRCVIRASNGQHAKGVGVTCFHPLPTRRTTRRNFMGLHFPICKMKVVILNYETHKNMEKAINTRAHPNPEKGRVRRQGMSKGPEGAEGKAPPQAQLPSVPIPSLPPAAGTLLSSSLLQPRSF